MLLTYDDFTAQGVLTAPAAVVVSFDWSATSATPVGQGVIQNGSALSSSGTATASAIWLDGAMVTVAAVDGAELSAASVAAARQVLQSAIWGLKVDSKICQLGAGNLVTGGPLDVELVAPAGFTGTSLVPALRGGPQLRTIQGIGWQGSENASFPAVFPVSAVAPPSQALRVVLTLGGLQVIG
jgi:hypothetical protein